MICDTDDIITEDLELNCDDTPTGGLKSIYIVRTTDATVTEGAEDTAEEGTVTAVTAAAGKIVKLVFNENDAFTNYTEAKTGEESGLVVNNCALVAQFPSMSLQLRNELEKLTVPFTEYYAFIEYNTGARSALGLDFGLRGLGANGASGAGRTEVNNMDLNLVGEEIHLARFIVDEAVWDSIINN
jgi:hypothetical protein